MMMIQIQKFQALRLLNATINRRENPSFMLFRIPSHPAVLFKCPFALKVMPSNSFDLPTQVTCLMCDSLQAMSNSFHAYWAMAEQMINIDIQRQICIGNVLLKISDILGVLIVYLSNDHKWAIYRGRLAQRLPMPPPILLLPTDIKDLVCMCTTLKTNFSAKINRLC